MHKKIRIAAIKFAGLAAGGTEKGLQTLMANLPKDKFDVDYFYCDAAPYIGSDWEHPDTDPDRKKYMENKGVNLIKFDVEYKDVTNPAHTWVGTNFWDLFNEQDYDILQTARAGHSEYPFHLINEIPQIDLITLPGMAERKKNIFRSVHISNYQANTWINAGGDPSKVEVIPLFDELPVITKSNFRKELGVDKNAFVFGFHQRVDDGIFSQVPLAAYSQIEDENTAFVLMGGSEKYEEQAWEIGIKNFHRIEHSGDRKKINKFLETLDVYAHGRSDGETYSMAIAEGMYHGLPAVSHVAPAMGHVETIGEAGKVAENVDEYIAELSTLKTNNDYYQKQSKKAAGRFKNYLSLESNIQKWILIYEKCVEEQAKNDLSDDDFWTKEWE